MIKKKYLTKKIWVDGEKWELVKYIAPNEFDDFLLLQRDTNSVHEYKDGTYVPAVEMMCLDCHNYEWYPDTKKVRRVMEHLIQTKEEYEGRCEDAEKCLYRIWLDSWARS